MKKEKSNLKRSLVRSWAFSYLGVCLVPVLFFIIFALSSSTIILRSAASENRLSLVSIKNLIDQAVEQNTALAEDIFLSTEINSNLSFKEADEITTENKFSSSNEIRHLINSHFFIEDALIYSPELNLYISPLRWGTISELIQRNELDLPLDQNERYELFSNDKINKLEIIDASYEYFNGRLRQRILLVRPLSYASNIGSAKLYLASIVDVGTLLPNYLSDYHDFLIVDERDNKILFDYTNSYIDSEEAEKFLALENNETRVVKNKIASASDASWTGLKYIVFVSKGVYYKYLEALIVVASVMLILTLLLGFFIIYRRTQKDWKTFEGALRKSGTDINWEESVESVYTPFLSSVEKKEREKEVMGDLIRRQTKSLQTNLISSLIDNPVLVSEDALKECGIEFISNRFAVLIIATESKKLSFDPVLLSNDEYRIFPFSSSFSFSAIVNAKEEGEDFYQNFARHIKKLIDENKEISSAASSNLKTGLEKIGEAYIEAINTEEYLSSTTRSKEFIFYRDIVGVMSKKNFSYSTDDEFCLESYIDSGDSERSEEFVMSLINRNRAMGIVSRNLRYLLFAIAGTIIRIENKISLKYDWSLPNITFSSIMQSENFESSLKEILDGLNAICTSIRNLRGSNAESGYEGYEIYRKALKEIRENYSSDQMNVSSLANKLEVTTVTLSKVFKRFHSMKISDYLSSTRIEEAKKLLLEGKSNSQIISSCGFGSERTFLRLFKRYENTTPGKYREMRGAKK